MLTNDVDAVRQVNSSRKTFKAGYLLQIRGKIRARHPKLTTTEPRHGSSKVTPSPNGKHPVPCYAFTGNVCVSLTFILSFGVERLMISIS
jgi:hypothetical protein